MNKMELMELAGHMGHDLSVHKKFYRLQEDVIELAKVSKSIIAVEEGKAANYTGKSLDDIDLDGRYQISYQTLSLPLFTLKYPS